MKMYFVYILIFVCLLIVGIFFGFRTDPTDRHSVRNLDLARYMGEWYEIARFDHSFERGLTDVRAVYKLLPNGRIDVLNSGCEVKTGSRRSAHGKAHAGSIPGRLRVSFFWFFYSDYNVMELDKEYQWALVGSRSAKYLWILSRTPQLPTPTLNHILSLARQRGYKTEKLLFVSEQMRPAGL